MAFLPRLNTRVLELWRRPPQAEPPRPTPVIGPPAPFRADAFEPTRRAPVDLGRAPDAPAPASSVVTDFNQRRLDARKSTDDALHTVDDMMGFDPGQKGPVGQALDALGGLLGRHSDPPRFREWAGDGMKPATAWPLSQLLGGELDHAIVGGDFKRADAVIQELEKYKQDGAYAPEPVSTAGTDQQRYYDDNAWIGLDLVQAYRQSGDRKYLEKAEALVPFLEKGFQPGGGILWRENDERPTLNTCANAPAMQLFLALHQETGNARYLDDAKHCETVLNGTLRRSDGLYDDNVVAKDPSQRSDWTFSYNQGSAIGANLQFAQASTDPKERERYLGLAKETADATLKKLEQDPDWLWKQSPAFNAVYFRNLMKLDAVQPDPRYRAALDAYVDRAQRDGRAGNGAYESGGIGRYGGEDPGGLRLIDQGGMAQILALGGMSSAELAKLG